RPERSRRPGPRFLDFSRHTREAARVPRLAPPRPLLAPDWRVGRLPHRLQLLAEPLRQARVHARADLRRAQALRLLRPRSRVLVERALRRHLHGEYPLSPARPRRRIGPAPQRGVRGARAAPRRRALPVHDPDHRGGDPLEVAPQRLLRSRESPPRLLASRPRALCLAPPRLHPVVAPPHQRVAVPSPPGG